METFVQVVSTVAALFLICVFAAFPTMWAVNYVFSPSAIMAVFGVSAIGFYKAFWLSFLCTGLFKSTSIK